MFLRKPRKMVPALICYCNFDKCVMNFVWFSMWDGFFSPRVSESHPSRMRWGWDSETSGEKSELRNPSHMENHTCTCSPEKFISKIKVIKMLWQVQISYVRLVQSDASCVPSISPLVHAVYHSLYITQMFYSQFISYIAYILSSV